MARCNDKIANVWAARVIPWLLAGIVGYVSWVVVALVCVDYVLRPPPAVSVQPRHGLAIAITIVYFVFLLPALWSYFRIIYTIATDPGYVPRGELWHQQRQRDRDQRETGKHHRKKSHAGARSSKKRSGRSWQDKDVELGHGDGGFGRGYNSTVPPAQRDMSIPPSGLEQFYTKDVFVCQDNGWPIWCTTCLNWKPDRTHHCSEVGRCVRKMDHFCPWAGGIISETNQKFFVQFVTYAAIYWVFVLIVMVFFVVERLRQSDRLNAHWVVALGFAGLFGLFAAGMTAGSTQLVLLNSTTVENLTRKTKVWQLAVLNPRPDTMGSSPSTTPKVGFLQVTYGPPGQRPNEDSSAVVLNQPSDASENHRPVEAPPPLRTFAILRTQPGENPWDLGKFNNFKSVLGDRWWDWFLPIKRSPCCDHSRGDSDFPLGATVNRMRREAGISPIAADETVGTSRRQSRHQSHRSSAAGETPPPPQGRGHDKHDPDGSRHSGKGRRDRRRGLRGRVESG